MTEFPAMRRKRQQLTDAQAQAILEQGQYGVLAVAGVDGWPYAVPLNYAYHDGSIILHCGLEGHKIDALRREPRVSFCVVAESRVIPDRFTDAYRSAIAFGRARLVEDAAERERLCTALALKYCADCADEIPGEIARFASSLAIVVIEVEHLTAKRGSAAS